MGGWGNEENFSDYTVLYDLGFPDWSHGIPKTPSKLLQTMFNFRSPYKIISYYTVELIASELINEFQKNLWLKCSVWSDLAKIRHFGKTLKALATLWAQKCYTNCAIFFMILDKFSLLWMAQFWKEN